jgi:hypothetical protein
MAAECDRSAHDGREKYSGNLLAGYAVNVSEEKRETSRVGIGLCADCRFMRRIESDRGSLFYLCELSATDTRFPKYPRLPVLRCDGYDPFGANRESK